MIQGNAKRERKRASDEIFAKSRERERERERDFDLRERDFDLIEIFAWLYDRDKFRDFLNI